MQRLCNNNFPHPWQYPNREACFNEAQIIWQGVRQGSFFGNDWSQPLAPGVRCAPQPGPMPTWTTAAPAAQPVAPPPAPPPDPRGPADLGQGMKARTSPAIAALAGGGYEMAFQANTGELIRFGTSGNINTHQGMAAGTSPAIAASPNGGFKVAFQANTGNLFSYTG